jgi:ubiquinone/menaquinone biosynthesis C-methylase UbiE
MQQFLQHATLTPGEAVLEVGCGDGLISFGTLDRVGEEGLVIFSDISQDLLDLCWLYRDAEGKTEKRRAS